MWIETKKRETKNTQSHLSGSISHRPSPSISNSTHKRRYRRTKHSRNEKLNNKRCPFESYTRLCQRVYQQLNFHLSRTAAAESFKRAIRQSLETGRRLKWREQDVRRSREIGSKIVSTNSRQTTGLDKKMIRHLKRNRTCYLHPRNSSSGE